LPLGGVALGNCHYFRMIRKFALCTMKGFTLLEKDCLMGKGLPNEKMFYLVEKGLSYLVRLKPAYATEV
jgi:hypothetical protein